MGCLLTFLFLFSFIDLTDVHSAPLWGSVRRGDEVFCCGGILSNSGPFAPKSTQDTSADTVPKQRPQHQHSSISTHITTFCSFVAHRPVCQRDHRPTRCQCVRMSSKAEGLRWKPEGQEQDRNWTPWLRLDHSNALWEASADGCTHSHQHWDVYL